VLTFTQDGYRVNGNALVLFGGIRGTDVDTRIVAPITLADDQIISWTGGKLFFGNGYEGAAPIPLPPNQTIDTAGHVLIVTGRVMTVVFDRISGSGGLTIGTTTQPGHAVLTDVSTYSGTTTVMNGRLALQDGANLGSTDGPTYVRSDGELELS